MRKRYCEGCRHCIRVVYKEKLYCARVKPYKKVTVRIGEDIPRWCPRYK